MVVTPSRLVPVTITDNLNRPVTGLDQDNFQLFEDKKPQEIKNFSDEDTPVSIGLIVDMQLVISQALIESPHQSEIVPGGSR